MKCIGHCRFPSFCLREEKEGSRGVKRSGDTERRLWVLEHICVCIWTAVSAINIEVALLKSFVFIDQGL